MRIGGFAGRVMQKPGVLRSENSGVFLYRAVIVRLVRNCALGRTIQDFVHARPIAGACDYWMPRLRGA